MDTNHSAPRAGLIVMMVVTLGVFGLPSLDAPPGPTATPDRLATPAVPANPSPVQRGRAVYYHHCMPCHGDVGQGLTDEWRAVWVADHQDCWARGCHAGRVGDQGFPIPHTVPPVAGGVGALARFVTADDLYDYLRRTHPPQDPGRLNAEEYRAVTDFLLEMNGRPAANRDRSAAVVLAASAVFTVGLLGAWLFARRQST